MLGVGVILGGIVQDFCRLRRVVEKLPRQHGRNGEHRPGERAFDPVEAGEVPQGFPEFRKSLERLFGRSFPHGIHDQQNDVVPGAEGEFFLFRKGVLLKVVFDLVFARKEHFGHRDRLGEDQHAGDLPRVPVKLAAEDQRENEGDRQTEEMAGSQQQFFGFEAFSRPLFEEDFGQKRVLQGEHGADPEKCRAESRQDLLFPAEEEGQSEGEGDRAEKEQREERAFGQAQSELVAVPGENGQRREGQSRSHGQSRGGEPAAVVFVVGRE